MVWGGDRKDLGFTTPLCHFPSHPASFWFSWVLAWIGALIGENVKGGSP